MNFYKHYIGDFQRDTGHLSLAERGAYRAMLDHYYATERPLPVDVMAVARLVGAMDEVERHAVERVLRDFWTRTEAGFTNRRADLEIAKAAAQRDTNREIGRRGGRPKGSKNKTEPETESVSQSVSESKPNREPNRNPNQTPDPRHRDTEVQGEIIHVGESARGEGAPQPAVADAPLGAGKPARAVPACPEGVDPDVWSAFRQLRTAKRAPITPIALAGIRREATAAGISLEAALRVCCERGWTGFKAEWAQPQPRASPRVDAGGRSAKSRDTAAFIHDLTGGLMGRPLDAPDDDHRTIDV